MGLFSLGRTVITPGAQDLAMRGGFNPSELLRRHENGDDGDLDAHDKAANRRAIKNGGVRVFSSYNTGNGKVWVITEADRSSTCTLLPDEY